MPIGIERVAFRLCGQRSLFVFNIAVLVLAMTYALLKGNVVASASSGLPSRAGIAGGRVIKSFLSSSLDYSFHIRPETKMNLCFVTQFPQI